MMSAMAASRFSSEWTRHERITGTCETIAPGTVPQDLWRGPTSLYPFPAAALATTVTSASANDTALGTGARSVYVAGLDAAGAEISEVVALAGLVAVPLAHAYYRVNRFRVSTVGTGGTNDGALSLRQGATVVGFMAAKVGQSGTCVYTVPGGKFNVRLLQWSVDFGQAAANAFATMLLLTRTLPDGPVLQIDHRHVLTGGTSFEVLEPPVPYPFTAFTDIWWRADETDAGANKHATGTIDVVWQE
jgi:hypothetical protein